MVCFVFLWYLVDSGAEISVIKEKCFTFNLVRIKGCTKGGSLNTLGTIGNDLMFDDICIAHTFHVVTEELNVPADDIIAKHRCVMDYNQMTFSFFHSNIHVIIPMLHLNRDDQETIVVPARSEVIRKINLKTSNEPQVVENEQIKPVVVIARTIVDPSKPYVRVLILQIERKL